MRAFLLSLGSATSLGEPTEFWGFWGVFKPVPEPARAQRCPLRDRWPRLLGSGGSPRRSAVLLEAQLLPLVTRPNPSPMRVEVCRASSEGLTSRRVLLRAPSSPRLPTQALLQKVSRVGWVGREGLGCSRVSPDLASALAPLGASAGRLVMGRTGSQRGKRGLFNNAQVRHPSREVSSVVSLAFSNPTCYR